MLLWIEGFDAYGTAVGVAAEGLEEVYPIVTGSANMVVRAGRLAQHSIGMRAGGTGFSDLLTPNLGDVATIIVGFGFRPAGVLTLSIPIELWEDDNTTRGINITLNVDGTASVRLDGVTLATSETVFTTNAWHYIELKVAVHNTNGSYELKINGVTVLSATGIDTRSGATNNFCNRVRFRSSGSTSIGNENQFDDIYILDTTGSTNNDFLGDRKVVTLFPSDNGSQNDFTTSSGGTDNYALVNDLPIDDSTYVESSTAGHRELYQFQDLVSVQTINGAQQNVVARKTDVPDFNLELIVKSDDTVDESEPQVVNSPSYDNYYRVLENDPDTLGPWTPAKLDAAEFGFDIG